MNIIEINYFKELNIPYRVKTLEIEEMLSEVTKIYSQVLVTTNINLLNIEVNTQIYITVNFFVNNIEIVRKFNCFITNIKKTISGKENDFIIDLFFSHELDKLNYSNNFYLWKNTTINKVINDLLVKANINIEGNIFGLNQNKNLVVQYGENNLHFLERLLQSYGFFYLCVEDSPTIKVYNSELAYEEINPLIKKYFFRKEFEHSINNIEYIYEHKKIIPFNYTNEDFNEITPTSVVSSISNSLISYGNLHVYPSPCRDMSKVDIDNTCKNIKKQFIDQIYEGKSYCFDFTIGKRILIDSFIDKPQVIFYVKHFFSTDITNSRDNYDYYNIFKTQSITSNFVSNKILKKPLISSMEVGLVKEEIAQDEISLSDNNQKILIKFNWVQENFANYIWVPVAQKIASKVFGTFIMPRVGDEVLIYFINGDPEKPVIYGSLHTKNTLPFAIESEDKYKITLIKSHTFNVEGSTSFNEISVYDKNENQFMFVKSRKDLYVEIGKSKEDIINHNYIIKLLGKCEKNEFIDQGDSILNMACGKKISNIGGDSITTIKKTTKGGDVFFTIEDGKLVLEVNGLGDQKFQELKINVSGNCSIHSDGNMNISSDGAMDIHSDTSIKLSAPSITNQADQDFSIKATDIKMDALSSFKVTSAMELALESGMNFQAKSGLQMSLEGGLETSIKSGVSMTIQSGVSCSINGGLNVSVMAGLQLMLNAGLMMQIVSGLTVDIMPGVSLTTASALFTITASAMGNVLPGSGIYLKIG